MNDKNRLWVCTFFRTFGRKGTWTILEQTAAAKVIELRGAGCLSLANLSGHAHVAREATQGCPRCIFFFPPDSKVQLCLFEPGHYTFIFNQITQMTYLNVCFWVSKLEKSFEKGVGHLSSGSTCNPLPATLQHHAQEVVDIVGKCSQGVALDFSAWALDHDMRHGQVES